MTPYYQDEYVTLYQGDCLDILPQLAGVTAVVTDPPYGLSFMEKDWDHGSPGQHFWELIKGACLPGAPPCRPSGGHGPLTASPSPSRTRAGRFETV